MKRLSWILEIIIFYVISFPLSLIPYRLIRRVGRCLGLLYYFLKENRRLIALENAKNFIEKNKGATLLSPKEIIKENSQNLGHSVMELVKIYYGQGDKVFQSVVIEGIENFEKVRGRGVIFITGHCGNWELMALTVSLRVFPVSVVARPMNNPYFNKIIEALRTKYRNTVVYKKGALKKIFQILRNGGAVGMLMDQAVVPEEGVIIDFLGRHAWTIKTPALIAKRTSAAVLPAFIKRHGMGHKLTIYPEVELPSENEEENTKKLSEFVENYVRENPTEWLWIHRRWKRGYEPQR